MVGTALRKYAERMGMTCDGGYVYGRVNQMHIALVDGTGVKMLQIYLCPPACDAGDVRMLQAKRILENCDARKYRLIRQNAVNVNCGRAVVVFQDGPGAMDRIERYINEVMPRLGDITLDTDACACCGELLGDGASYVLMDDCILPVHPHCVPELTARTSVSERENSGGRLLPGVLGALIGASVGAALWAVLYMMGYLAGVAGLLIGILSGFFYGRLKGKRGRVRTAIVIAALILGVLAGQAGGMAGMYARSYAEAGGAAVTGLTQEEYILCRFERVWTADQSSALGRQYDRLAGNLPESRLPGRDEFIRSEWDQEYDSARSEELCELRVNLAMGLFFGGLSAPGLFSKQNREKRRHTVRRLK